MRNTKLILLPIFAMSLGMLTGCNDEINSAISDIQSHIDDMQSDIDDLKIQIKDLKDQIAKLEGEMNDKIAAVKQEYLQKIAAAETEIESLNTELNNFKIQYASDKKAIEDDYNAKLAALEEKLQNADQVLATQLQQEKEALQADYTSKINALQTAYQSKVQEIESNIATLNTNISNLQTELANQVTAIQNDYNGKINDLTERVSVLEEVQTHTVSFDTKGAGEIDPQVIVHGEKARKPEDPARAGATFKGWSYHDEPWYFYSSVVTEDMELVAQWELINYRVVFKNDDGTVLETIENAHYGDTVTYSGETPIKPNQEEHYIYTFSGWDKDLVVNGDMEFIAQYNKEYTPFQEIYLDANGGTLFSRYVPEDGLVYSSITADGIDLDPVEGLVYVESEEAVQYGGSARSDENDHNGARVAYFDPGDYFTHNIFSSREVDCEMQIAVCGEGQINRKLNKHLSITLNGEDIAISDDVVITSTSWESWDVLNLGKIHLACGANTIVVKCLITCDVDYISFKINKFELSDYGISNPTKDSDGSLQYQFYKWELQSNENDIIIYRPVFSEATIGLDFVDNKVDIYHGEATEVFIPEYWNGNVINEIGQNSFGSTKVVNVHLPETITLISGGAFKLATKLTTINFPRSLKTIEYEAFQECVKLKTVEFNDGLQFIGNRSFQSSGLEEVTFPSSVKTLGERCFAYIHADFIYVPATISEIAWGCFNSDEAHTNVIYCEREFRPSAYDANWAANSEIIWGFKSKIEKDGFEYAIYEIDDVEAAAVLDYDHSLTEFEVPETINGIPVKRMLVSFKGNDKLERVVLPNFIEQIPSHMFEGCSSLQYVDIPSSVSTIGEYAFYELYDLETVVLHEGLKVIDRFAFMNCTSLENITLPNGLTNIYGRAFQSCSSLTTLVLPESIKMIEGAAFQGSSITHIDIPDSITVMTEALFMDCLSLNYIVFPGTLKSISAYAFAGTPNLHIVYFRGTEEQWNALPQYDGTNNQLNGTTKYFYSETEPATPGNFWHYVEGTPTIW